MAYQHSVTVDGRSLTIERVEAVARGGASVTFDSGARTKVAASRRVVDEILSSGTVAYGINTGFGRLAEVRIPPDQLEQLQLNLLRSHACGVGEPFPEDVVRAMLLLRANVLATGHAGCRPVVVERVLDLLGARVHPVVPSLGSVGASGDLAPLAHLALPLVGEGRARVNGETLSGGEALKRAGLEPVVPAAKEGLALINGTQASAAVGALALVDASRLLDAADVICALTLDALAGTDAAFEPSVHEARPHPGQIESARRLHRLLDGSAIRDSHRDCGRVQDAYSLRCSPQVHGASRDAFQHARRVLEIELNSATDNPMVFADGRIISGGNFHGAPIAAVFDYLAATLTDLASISERRFARMVDASLSGLPRFLVEDAGLNSGFMMVQVSAAALVSECKTLSHPASVDSIPTSAGQEDHVSMSTWASRKLARVVELVRKVLGMELLAAAQALEFHRPLTTSPALEDVVRRLRDRVPRYEDDRFFADDMEAAADLLFDLADETPGD
ncbi:MAG: histidine ammonia-lyase [Thermoanaerobaculales bacterium]|jgi:histidine ammonia-lyase|nr:histidine ammonia-lyase [Thermoanaerobaculales bacterium]